MMAQNFNAAAVKKALDRTIEMGQGSSWIFGPIESIEAVDDLIVQFNLLYSAPLDLILSAGYAAWIMSPNAADQDSAWFNDGNAAGTGPVLHRQQRTGPTHDSGSIPGLLGRMGRWSI